MYICCICYWFYLRRNDVRIVRQVNKMNEEKGLTVNELVNKLLEIPNQEQRVVMHIYKDGIFLKDEVRDVCQANLEVVII